MLDEPESVSRSVVRHVATCLRCQAEVARYRRTRRLLRQLHDRHPSALAPDADLDGPHADAEPEPESDPEPASSSSGRRLVLVGGIAAATLAAAATVTVVGRGWVVRAVRAS
jgi:anti-sigma factor RsiW